MSRCAYASYPPAERNASDKMQPVFEKRRPIVKAIPKFWPVALLNHELFSLHCQHRSDQMALSYMEDLWVVRDPAEFRAFTIEFVSRFRRVCAIITAHA